MARPVKMRCGAAHRGPLVVAALLLAALCGLSAATISAQEGADTSPRKNPAAVSAQYTRGGTETCLRCHGGERMLVMEQTVHGKLDNSYTPYAQHGCESCHGPGSVHASRARGGIGFPALVTFADDEAAAPQNQACLSCHGKSMGDMEGMAWTGSAHDTDSVTCMDCHQGHSTENLLAGRDAQITSCSNCHADQIRNHRRFEGKGILWEQLDCYTCHDVHQLENAKE